MRCTFLLDFGSDQRLGLDADSRLRIARRIEVLRPQVEQTAVVAHGYEGLADGGITFQFVILV